MNKPANINEIDKRGRSFRGAELRAESQGDEMALAGYAATFNCLSSDLGGFREMIAPTAFNRTLESGADVKCLFQHDAGKVLGRTKNGTLQVSTDERGLKFRCALDKNSALARDVYAAVKRGDVDECSFMFTVPDGGDQWEESVDERGNKFMRRTLRNIDLMEVSSVSFPAYPSTNVGARSADYVALSTEAWRTQALARLNAAMQTKPVTEPPTTEELRARAARFGTQMATRAGAAVDETEEDDMQDLVTARFGMARNGIVPRYIVTETHSNHVVACDMNEDEMSFCCIPYSRDDDRVSFGEPEISSASYPTRSLTLLEAKSKVAFVQRMAAESGRTFRR